MRDLVRTTLEEHRQVVAKMAALEGEIASAGELCSDVLAQGRRIYLCGNGGSAADAQHIAAELIARFVNDRRSLPDPDLREYLYVPVWEPLELGRVAGGGSGQRQPHRRPAAAMA